jgi:hypothetical protein
VKSKYSKEEGMCIRPLLSALAAVGVAASLAVASDEGSAGTARELVQGLSSRQLSAIAAKDPDTPGRYIAALSFPDVQLLVVAASYPAPQVLDDAIARKDYQTVYAALQGPDTRAGKVFFQDMGADGLRADGDGSVDVMYEQGTNQTLFDGNRKAKDKFAKADATYERLLKILLAQTKNLS